MASLCCFFSVAATALRPKNGATANAAAPARKIDLRSMLSSGPILVRAPLKFIRPFGWSPAGLPGNDVGRSHRDTLDGPRYQKRQPLKWGASADHKGRPLQPLGGGRRLSRMRLRKA